MTDSQLKIRIQIPQSSQPKDDARHHSIPDIPEGQKDIGKAPFDMQKIFITLFVIFLTISSFVYLVFIDESKLSSTLTERPTITNESVLPASDEIMLEAPIEKVESLSQPVLVEDDVLTIVSPQPIENESLEAPAVVEKANNPEPAASIIEITETNKPALEILEPLINTYSDDQPQVIQAQLTSAIQQREPIDEIDHIELNHGTSERIHFFMRLRDLDGQQVSVRWFYQNKEVAQIKLPIGNNEQWRTHANKLLPKTRPGQWHVELQDASGNLLAQRNFTVSSNP